MLWNWKPWFWDFFSSKCISKKEKKWRDVKNEALDDIWCCNIFSLGYTWEHKTQLNIPGKITYGNIIFLLSQTQLAKNSSELKLTCFFFSKCIFNYFLSKNPNFVLTVWVGKVLFINNNDIYTHVNVRNVWYFFKCNQIFSVFEEHPCSFHSLCHRSVNKTPGITMGPTVSFKAAAKTWSRV